MFNKLIKSLERTGNERLRIYLLGMSDAFLIEYGFSRESLQRGVEEWPWKIEPQPSVITSETPIALKREKKNTQKKLHDAMEPLDWVA